MVKFLENNWFSFLTALFLVRLIGLGANIGDAIALIALVSYYIYQIHVSKQKLTDSQRIEQMVIDFNKEQTDKLSQIHNTVLSVRMDKGLKKVENEQKQPSRYF